MIKVDIVKHVAEKTGIPIVKAEIAVDAFFNAMKNALARGERMELRGFGIFTVQPRKRGVGRNPRTKEIKPIPEGLTVRFRPGSEIK
jgi:DNA-binding protein HU-beta